MLFALVGCLRKGGGSWTLSFDCVDIEHCVVTNKIVAYFFFLANISLFCLKCWQQPYYIDVANIPRIARFVLFYTVPNMRWGQQPVVGASPYSSQSGKKR